MERIPRGRYTREFREEAVKLITEEKLSLPEAGRRLNLAPSTIGNWVKAYKAGKLSDIGKSYRPLTDIELELYRVKRENVELNVLHPINQDLAKGVIWLFQYSSSNLFGDL